MRELAIDSHLGYIYFDASVVSYDIFYDRCKVCKSVFHIYDELKNEVPMFGFM